MIRHYLILVFEVELDKPFLYLGLICYVKFNCFCIMQSMFLTPYCSCCLSVVSYFTSTSISGFFHIIFCNLHLLIYLRMMILHSLIYLRMMIMFLEDDNWSFCWQIQWSELQHCSYFRDDRGVRPVYKTFLLTKFAVLCNKI